MFLSNRIRRYSPSLSPLSPLEPLLSSFPTFSTNTTTTTCFHHHHHHHPHHMVMIISITISPSLTKSLSPLSPLEPFVVYFSSPILPPSPVFTITIISFFSQQSHKRHWCQFSKEGSNTPFQISNTPNLCSLRYPGLKIQNRLAWSWRNVKHEVF